MSDQDFRERVLAVLERLERKSEQLEQKSERLDQNLNRSLTLWKPVWAFWNKA